MSVHYVVNITVGLIKPMLSISIVTDKVCSVFPTMVVINTDCRFPIHHIIQIFIFGPAEQFIDYLRNKNNHIPRKRRGVNAPRPTDGPNEDLMPIP